MARINMTDEDAPRVGLDHPFNRVWPLGQGCFLRAIFEAMVGRPCEKLGVDYIMPFSPWRTTLFASMEQVVLNERASDHDIIRDGIRQRGLMYLRDRVCIFGEDKEEVITLRREFLDVLGMDDIPDEKLPANVRYPTATQITEYRRDIEEAKRMIATQKNSS